VAFKRASISVVVVTNQSSIAPGYFTWNEFDAVQAEIERQLAAEADARIDAGMLSPLPIAWVSASRTVGDCVTEIAAGRDARIASGLHVSTGCGDRAQRQAAMALKRPRFRVESGADLRDALPLRDLMIGRTTRC